MEVTKELTLYQPPKRILVGTTIFEGDLAQLLATKAVRQLCIFQTKNGWMVKVLSKFHGEFLTLVDTRKKEARLYSNLDRLISAVLKHGPLPTTLLIGE